jgi:hypothetical protein
MIQVVPQRFQNHSKSLGRGILRDHLGLQWPRCDHQGSRVAHLIRWNKLTNLWVPLIQGARRSQMFLGRVEVVGTRGGGPRCPKQVDDIIRRSESPNPQR